MTGNRVREDWKDGTLLGDWVTVHKDPDRCVGQ